MNQKQLERMTNAKGFIAALDQSGGSTPKALALYGVKEDAYHNAEEMFDCIHKMRTRMITSPAFSSAFILGAILFRNTIDREIDGMLTADYLWEKQLWYCSATARASGIRKICLPDGRMWICPKTERKRLRRRENCCVRVDMILISATPPI